ncbi:sugar kinase [Rugosimonospora acidiphila]|uniref:Sugar kinase n=1 Tax=Rugosimonospora acidiphila TaxID=556531 RepID=A0ABP9SG12_9ACTN
MADLVTLGEAMLVLRGGQPGPLRVGSPFVASVAGAEATVAIGMARLGHSTRWVGRVGADSGGELVLSSLRESSVDVSLARVDPAAPTGLLLRSPRTPALTAVEYYRSGSAGSRIDAADVADCLTPGTRILHLTGITAALSESAAGAVLGAVASARAAGVAVSYDVNHRTRLCSVETAGQRLRAILPDIEVLFCGTDELAVLAAATGSEDDPVSAALGLGVAEVVVKDGPRGAAVVTRDQRQEVPAVPVTQVVDVVGAGDAFVAGYLSARIDGLPPRERLRRGASVAAFCVSCAGDWEGLPRREELPLMELPAETTLR